MEFMRNTLEGGITAVRDCGGKEYIEFAIRDAYNSGRFLGPTMRCAGRMICMTGGHGNRTGRVADGVDEVVKAVREQVHAGADLIKIMATGGVMTPGVNPEDAHYSAEEMKAGISEATYFNWKKRYDGLLPDEMRRLKLLEDENSKLKKLVADLSLDKAMLQDVLRRKM